MAAARRKVGWIIAASFIVALLLTSLPLPRRALEWQPLWVPLAVIYWCLVRPEWLGIGRAWLVGLALDATTDALLGQNALGLSLVAYLAHNARRRLLAAPAVQQSLFVCFYLLLFLLPGLGVRALVGTPLRPWTFWWPAVASAFLWLLLLLIRRRARPRM